MDGGTYYAGSTHGHSFFVKGSVMKSTIILILAIKASEFIVDILNPSMLYDTPPNRKELKNYEAFL